MDIAQSFQNIQWGPALEGFGTGMSFFGKLDQADALSSYGDSALSAANASAGAIRQTAGQAVAASQYQALEISRQGDVANSRAMALLAASGAGASDPTAVTLLARLRGVTDQNQATALYKGNSEAQALNDRAAMTDYEGQLQKWGANNQAGAATGSAWGGLLKGAIGMYDKYGKGSPATNGSGTLDTSYVDGGGVLTDPAFGY